jgi:site-specific DNA-cytosine methylase
MNELHLFAGAGGGILGGELLGHTTVCAVEIEPYPRKVLLQRQRDGILPRFPIWDDITTFDGNPWRGRVDVVCGGFPCQDISAAGKGAGITGARSGLWGEMARVIREVRPRFVFVENSPMLTSRGLGTVLGDLAAMGFDARWCVLGACDAGAPHKRERIWICAERNRLPPYTEHVRNGRREQFEASIEKEERCQPCRGFFAKYQCAKSVHLECDCPKCQGYCVCEDMADAARIQQGREEQRPERKRAGAGSESAADVADAGGKGLQRGEQPRTLRDERDGAQAHGPVIERGSTSGSEKPCDFCGYEFDSELLGIYGCPNCLGEGLDVADADSVSGRPGTGGQDEAEASDSSWWITEPDVGRVAHGVASRVDRLKAIGNGQVPAVAALAWKILTGKESKT